MDEYINGGKTTKMIFGGRFFILIIPLKMLTQSFEVCRQE